MPKLPTKLMVKGYTPGMDEPQYNKGGWLPGGPALVKLDEGEGIRDQQGRLRARVIDGRLVRLPMWLSNLLPRVPGR